MRTKNPDITITVTEDHFARAVPGDPCHCTIGEAVHDSLDRIIPALDLAEVDASTIAVHPANVGTEPAVSVGFVGTDAKGTEVTVRFLMVEASAFKVAYVTDNRSAAGMRRAARKNPYQLRTSGFQIRQRDARTRKDTASNPTVTPRHHITGLASNSSQRAATAAEAVERTLAKLESKSKAGELPYKLTAPLKKLAAAQAEKSFANRGTKPRSSKAVPVKVYSNKRFYS